MEPRGGAPSRGVPFTLHRVADAAELAETAAAALVGRALYAQTRGGIFRLALAGGSTPRRLYQRLSQPDLAERIDWSRVQVFFGDERCVPPDHPDSNFRMARETLLEGVPIPDRNVHRIDGEAPPDQAAHAYEARMATRPLDLALLGMGADGHTASLFPGGPELEEGRRWVVATTSPLPPPQRVSLSLPALNAAKAVFFLVSGPDKAALLAQVMEALRAGEPGPPASRVRPRSGELHWFVDAAAAGQLPSQGGPA